MMPEYPGTGNPCNGCGLCCLAEPCPVSLELFGQSSQCPALEFDGGRFRCALMTNPGDYGAIPEGVLSLDLDHEMAASSYYRQLIGAGMGCDSEIDAFVDLFRVED